MCANSSERMQTRERGFTLPELIAVVMLISILAATALPKLQGALSFRDDAWHDQVVAGLRYAHQTAIGHRRLVCADLASGRLTLSVAAANPAVACSAALPGIDGSSASADSQGAAAAASVSPAGSFYFQPSGRVTTDGAGATAVTRTISIAGEDDIVLVGETGRVD